MKPILSYYGGKQKLASRLVRLIPKHTVYVEPFAGGATLLFAKPWPNVTSTNEYNEVINDTDERLITFYRVLRDEKLGPELVRKLELTLYSESEYALAGRILSNPSGYSELDRAWAYYVSIQQSFAKKLRGGWGRSVWGENHGAAWTNKVSRLRKYLARMASVHISCTDALTCIRQWDSPQTFFYCDPPYVGTHLGHYSGYTEEDFARLCDVLDSIQGSFLLSCYDNEITRRHIRPRWERFEFPAFCSASGKGRVGADRTRKATLEELGDMRRIEVVYRKRRSAPLRPEIERLFASGRFDCFIGDWIQPGLFGDPFWIRPSSRVGTQAHSQGDLFSRRAEKGGHLKNY